MEAWAEKQAEYFRQTDEFPIYTDISNLQAGDLLYYTQPLCGDENCEFTNEIHHVAFYMGDGIVVEASLEEGIVVHKMELSDMKIINLVVRIGNSFK